MLKKLLVLFIALSVGFTSTIDIRAVVEDTTPPMVTGVEEGGIYKAPVTIGFDEGIAMLNDVEIANPTTVSELGEYVLVVTDQSNNVTTVHFSLVEAVAPVVLGVTNGASYTDPVTITFDEGTATLNGNAFVSGSLVSVHGAYTLVVTDEHDNVTTVNFSIVAKTAAVSGLKVTNAGYNAISLSWTAVSNVTGYEIWRSIGTSTTYGGLTTVYTNSFMNTGLAFNTKYNYKVRVFTLINNVKVYGAFSVIGSATTALTTPVTSVVSASYNSIRVSWAAIPGVSGYQVYRATSLAGTYTLLTSTSATSYTNSLLTTNTLYYYKVRGYRTVGTLKYYSAYSTVLSARPIPSQVIGNSVVSSGYNSLKASWAAVSGATGYEVYKSSAVDGTYTLVLTTGLTSYSFTSLPTNIPLFVKVRAYRLVGTVKVYGAFSTIQSSSPIPSNPLVTLTSLSYKSLKLSWAAVSGATGYEVYHREGENYVLVQESSDLSLTVDGLVSGVTHDYKVIAYRMEGETKVYSKETLISGKALPSVPSVSSLVNYNTIKLKWNAVEGAIGYEIHRSATATGTFTLLSTVDVLEYNHLALVFNTSYFYKVRAYVVVNDVKVYGNFTGVLSIKTNVATPIVTAKSASYISTTVTWAAVSGASGYEISRATVLAGPYTVIVPATSATSYTNSALTTNTLYYYRVRSYRLVGTVKYYSAYSTVVSVRPVPAVPAGANLTSVGYDSARLGWVAVTGATGYEVFTSDALGGTYMLKATTSGLSATISGLFTNVLVYAKVRAYRLVGTTKVYGDYSSIVNVAPIPAKPVVTVGNLSHTSIKVSWPMIAGADGYEVYHLVGSDYVLVQDNNELSLTVNELVSGEVHTYKVIAYRIVNDVRVYSQETIASGKAFPLTPVVTAAINYASIQLNWATVEGASGYEVVRSATSTGTYALLASVNTNTYLNSGLAFNTTYYYKVRAYALVNDVKVYGNYTGILTYKTNVLAPVVSAVSTSYISTNVSWTAVSGASGYEVSRATALAGPYTVLVAATSATSYANSALTTNTLYYYRVRSYRLVGTVKYYSAYSTVVSVRPVPAIPSSVTLTSIGYDSLKVSWSAVTGASGYELFTSNAVNGTYTLKTTTSALTANISGYPTMMQVFAKVRAYRLVGTTKVYGALSNAGVGQPYPSKPVVSASYPAATSVKISWPAVPGATGYYIMLLGSMGSHVISKQPELDFTLIDCTPGEGYYFTVIAYVDLGINGEAQSDGTNIYTVPVPPSVKNFRVYSTDYSEIVLKWDAVPGAFGYEIYHSTSATGTFTLLKDTKETYFSHFALTFNSTHYYKIRAYAFGKTATIFGSTSAVLTGKTALKTPTASISAVSPTSIKVTWPSILGASKYEIYRSTSATGTYTLIGTSTTSEYTNTGLTLGASYYYKVRGINVVGVTNYYSAFSAPVLGKTALIAPAFVFIDGVASTYLSVMWGASQGATGYELYAALQPSTEYTLVYSGPATSTIHANLQLNQRYSYKARSYATVNGVKIYSPYTAQIAEGFVGVNVPRLNVRQKDNMEIEFYYDESDSRPFQNGAEIYIVDPVTEELTLYKTAWNRSWFTYTDYVGKTNQTLTFVFVGLNYGRDNVLMKSEPSEPVTLVLENPTLTGFRITSVERTRVSLGWDYTSTPVEIWRSDTIDGEYTLQKTWPTGSQFFSDDAVVLGKKYFYKIRRISVDQQTMLNVYSEFTEPLQAGPGFLKPYFMSEPLTPNLISYTVMPQSSAAGYEICEVNDSGTIIGDCPAVDVDVYSGTIEVDADTTYHLVSRAYLYLPDGSKYYSEFSDPITVTTPMAPNLVISTVTTFDSKSTVTFDFKNSGGRAIEIIGVPTYVYDISDVYAEYPAVMKDGANVAITHKTIGAGVTQRITFTISTPNITFNSNRFIAFQVVYDGYEYVLCYSPYLGIFYFAYF